MVASDSVESNDQNSLNLFDFRHLVEKVISAKGEASFAVLGIGIVGEHDDDGRRGGASSPAPHIHPVAASGPEAESPVPWQFGE